MLKELIKLASELDDRGLTKEADALDQIIIEAQSWSDKLIGTLSGAPRELAQKGMDRISDTLPKREEDPMEIARKQEQEAKINKEKESLKAAKDWFTENIFVSVADKFPVVVDRDLYLGYGRAFWGQALSGSGLKKQMLIIPEGTEFDSLEQKKPLKNGQQTSLREAWENLKNHLSRLGVN